MSMSVNKLIWSFVVKIIKNLLADMKTNLPRCPSIENFVKFTKHYEKSKKKKKDIKKQICNPTIALV